MQLAAVIPAYNSAGTIGPLVADLLRQPFVAQVIVVDDASTDTTASTASLAASGDPRFRLVRQPENRGAGAARNRGMLEITAPYAVFLDADDAIVPDVIGAAVGHLDRFGGDFILYRYATFRHAPAEMGAMNRLDVDVWRRQMEDRELVAFTRDEGAGFLALVNFPWTRIHRTAALRAYGLHFSETRVHNDVFAHWQSFLESERFIAFNRVGVLHKVSGSDHHLNNQFTRQRFDIFTAFEEVDRLFQGRSDRAALHPFYLFFRVTVLDWIHANLPRDLMAEFQGRVARAFADFDADSYARCRRLFGSVADRCVRAKLSPASVWPIR
ncbi:glycosyltransferase family 2 protein [Chthonobacter rhizosphaerae]|uniref:glycosyltransferase family 2 protein n=1 Tax=Chthonobacter rhizosphaerae TaxID=2735553 RepID=UPI0015EF415D|nr:glycosyltransferase family 2 protein [Chthonobacter rhizosphaerae]